MNKLRFYIYLISRRLTKIFHNQTIYPNIEHDRVNVFRFSQNLIIRTHCIFFNFQTLSKIEILRLDRSFAEIPGVCKAQRQLTLAMKYLEEDYSNKNLTIVEFMESKIKLDCLPGK